MDPESLRFHSSLPRRLLASSNLCACLRVCPLLNVPYIVLYVARCTGGGCGGAATEVAASSKRKRAGAALPCFCQFGKLN